LAAVPAVAVHWLAEREGRLSMAVDAAVGPLDALARGAINASDPVPKARRRRWRRSLMVLDLIGLILGLWACSRYIENHSTRGYIAVLGSVALFLWALCATWKYRSPLRRNSFFPVVLAPLVAGTATFGLAMALGALHPTDGTVAFVVVWAVWLVTVRIVMRRSSPRVRALVASPSDGCRDFAQLHGLEMIYMDAPPADFLCDIAVLEPLTQYSADWQRWFVHADLAGIPIMGGATLIETVTGRISTAELSGVWAPEVFPGDSTSTYAPWKRLMDVVVTLLALPLLVPVCLVVGLAVLLGSGRPLFFSQLRVGRSGVPFRIVKFRTMSRPGEGTEPCFAQTLDPRVTLVGAVIRRLRLDELPQFWNVLRGDMSIIGPRPEQLYFAQHYSERIPLYDIRHHVKPGITGWAQVTHGYTSGSEETREKLRCDLYYIKHYSLVTDARIVMKTVKTVLTGFGWR